MTINTLLTIAEDVGLIVIAAPNEGRPHGVPTGYNWCKSAVSNNPECPEGWTAVNPWGVIYRDIEDTQDKALVEIRGLKLWGYNRKKKTWKLIQAAKGIDGGLFEEDIASNRSKSATIINKPDGTSVSQLEHGYCLHFWPKQGRATIKPEDVGVVLTTFQARIIGGAGSAKDARYLGATSGDWWRTRTAKWAPPPNRNNLGIGQARMKYLKTHEWLAFNCINVRGADFLALDSKPELD